MNTNNNNPTRSENNSHNGQLSKDTNALKKYKAWLSFIQQKEAKVIIEAASRDEAWDKASAIKADEIDQWHIFNGAIDVAGIDLVEEGGADDE
jgi:hypothetical protein